MKSVPNRAQDARRKAESQALWEDSGKFKTGVHKNKAEKRARTRQAAVQKAMRESGDE